MRGKIRHAFENGVRELSDPGPKTENTLPTVPLRQVDVCKTSCKFLRGLPFWHPIALLELAFLMAIKCAFSQLSEVVETFFQVIPINKSYNRQDVFSCISMQFHYTKSLGCFSFHTFWKSASLYHLKKAVCWVPSSCQLPLHLRTQGFPPFMFKNKNQPSPFSS